MILPMIVAASLPPIVPRTACMSAPIEKLTDVRQARHGAGLWIGGFGFGAADIASAKAAFDANTGQPVVDLGFTPSGQAKFARAQTCRLRRTISIWIDDRLVAQAILPAPVLGAGIVIAGSFTAEEALGIAARLSSLTAKTTL